MSIRGKRIGILGYGLTGRSLKKLCDKLGVKTFISDMNQGDEKENTYRILMCDIVSPSPGIPPHHRILSRVETSNIPILPEIEIGWRYLYGKTIAITGTNGKSTTAYFTHKLIRGSYICGNWGKPVSDLAFKRGVFVIEVSSFQLHYTKEFRADVSVITNVSPDHLDWHGSFENYLRDKLKILKNQKSKDFSVLNMDDAYFQSFKRESKGNMITVSMKNRAADVYSDGSTIFMDGLKLKVPNKLRKPSLIYDLMFAISSAYLLGVKEFPIDTLEPLKGRIEFVKRVGNVEFYDDSKGTNPHATRCALESFDRVVLIMGGDNKGLRFDELRDAVKEKVKVIVAIGKSKNLIKETFEDLVDVILAEDMYDAVRKAYALSNGEPVLLSPACASFDMFRDYKHRSEVFRKAVDSLSALEFSTYGLERETDIKGA